MRFPETLDCDGDAPDGECDFIFETPRSEIDTHGRYLLLSTVVRRRGRVVVHQQPADSEDLEKVDARRDLQRKGCGEQHVLHIRVCDLPWPPSSKSTGVVARPFLPTRWWGDPDHGPNYTAARARLVSEGYRPVKFEHDDRDLCTEDFWSHVCKRMPEAVDCQTNTLYGYCDFVFERPRGDWAVHGPYLLVQAAVSEDASEEEMVVVHQKLAGTDDLQKIWARKKLKRRGCQEDRPLHTRVCDPAWSPESKEPKSPSPVVLPPLPPSPR
jgi:hypothetical protein